MSVKPNKAKLMAIIEPHLNNLQVLDKNTQQATIKAGNTTRFMFSVQNQTEIDWPEDTKLTCENCASVLQDS